jgi:hypothetical protein
MISYKEVEKRVVVSELRELLERSLSLWEILDIGSICRPASTVSDTPSSHRE